MLENEIKSIQELPTVAKADISAKCECGASLAANQKFCSICGKDVEQITTQATAALENVKRCSTCGANMKEAAKFCTKCGTKQ